MNIIDWNPGNGDALQGDVCLFRIPDRINVSTEDEIAPRDGRLILAEGEISGHHHAIGLQKYTGSVTHFHDEALARANAQAAAILPTARLFRDPSAVRALIDAKELTTPDLAIGFLIIENGPMVLAHDEHDAIRIPVGRYYVGGQQEFDAAQARRVQD